MATAAVGDAPFFLGSCPVCGKNVLTYADFDTDGGELRRCLHCAALITSGLQAATSSDLEAYGYHVVEPSRCGAGGGCAAGSCGMRKR